MFAGQLQGLFDADDADLLAVGTDEPNLRYADPLVDARFSADVSSRDSCGWVLLTGGTEKGLRRGAKA